MSWRNATPICLNQRGDGARDPSYYDAAVGNGKATTAPEAANDVGDDARPAADSWAPFYARLKQRPDKHDFDE